MSQATFSTHEVFNQSPPFEGIDLYAVDRPLAEAVAANGGVSADDELSEFGNHWGSAAMADAAALPTRTRRNCAPSIPEAAAATRSSFIRPITN